MSTTIKQAAESFATSERCIDLARELQRCRPDLADSFLAAELTKPIFGCARLGGFKDAGTE